MQKINENGYSQGRSNQAINMETLVRHRLLQKLGPHKFLSLFRIFLRIIKVISILSDKPYHLFLSGVRLLTCNSLAYQNLFIYLWQLTISNNKIHEKI